MQLFLIRHGIAAERGLDYPDDGQRPLTDRGWARMQREADALAALDVVFDVILTSPLVRARQTADILAAGGAGRPGPPVIDCEALGFGGTTDEVLDLVSGYLDAVSVALVGHEPGLGELARTLIGAQSPVRFKKGAVCRIDVSRDRAPVGELRWFLPPRVLRAVGMRGAAYGEASGDVSAASGV